MENLIYSYILKLQHKISLLGSKFEYSDEIKYFKKALGILNFCYMTMLIYKCE